MAELHQLNEQYDKHLNPNDKRTQLKRISSNLESKLDKFHTLSPKPGMIGPVIQDEWNDLFGALDLLSEPLDHVTDKKPAMRNVPPITPLKFGRNVVKVYDEDDSMDIIVNQNTNRRLPAIFMNK